MLVSGSRDNTVQLWEVATGTVLRTFIGHSYIVVSVAFSPDGKTLGCGSAGASHPSRPTNLRS
ncbi:MAG: WD40 repeat domain-containing protein [Pyrinomonadaceae bacterium]